MKTTLTFGATLAAMALATLMAIFSALGLQPRAGQPATLVGQAATSAPVAAVVDPQPSAPAIAATAERAETTAAARPVREVHLEPVVITRTHRTAKAAPVETASGPTASRPFMWKSMAD